MKFKSSKLAKLERFERNFLAPGKGFEPLRLEESLDLESSALPLCHPLLNPFLGFGNGFMPRRFSI
jgi:hypothetical protein